MFPLLVWEPVFLASGEGIRCVLMRPWGRIVRIRVWHIVYWLCLPCCSIMLRMEKVVNASCILMSLLGYSTSWHLIKVCLARAINYPSPQCWNSTCKRENRLLPLCTDLNGGWWREPKSWSTYILARRDRLQSLNLIRPQKRLVADDLQVSLI